MCHHRILCALIRAACPCVFELSCVLDIFYLEELVCSQYVFASDGH